MTKYSNLLASMAIVAASASTALAASDVTIDDAAPASSAAVTQDEAMATISHVGSIVWTMRDGSTKGCSVNRKGSQKTAAGAIIIFELGQNGQPSIYQEGHNQGELTQSTATLTGIGNSIAGFKAAPNGARAQLSAEDTKKLQGQISNQWLACTKLFTETAIELAQNNMKLQPQQVVSVTNNNFYIKFQGLTAK